MLGGRNGEGKSTLLRVINGTITADSGEISRRQGLKVAQLEQEVPTDLTGTIKAIVMSALGEIGDLLEAYYQVIEVYESLDKLDKLQSRIDALDGWGLNSGSKRCSPGCNWMVTLSLKRSLVA